MQGQKRDRVPFLGGRNFIESIVYTLTYIEFQARLDYRRENLSFLVVELERQLCGLARAVPQIKKIYHSYVRETLKEMYKNYPLPSLGPACPVRDLLIEWMSREKEKLLGINLDLVSEEQANRQVQAIVDSILHQAIMGTLYKAGVLSHA